MDRYTGHRDTTEKILKTALDNNQSINVSMITFRSKTSLRGAVYAIPLYLTFASIEINTMVYQI